MATKSQPARSYSGHGVGHTLDGKVVEEVTEEVITPTFKLTENLTQLREVSERPEKSDLLPPPTQRRANSISCNKLPSTDLFNDLQESKEFMKPYKATKTVR